MVLTLEKDEENNDEEKREMMMKGRLKEAVIKKVSLTSVKSKSNFSLHGQNTL